VFGHDAGAVLGNLALHAAAIVGIVVVAHRRGGALVAAVAAATVAALCWSLGSAALVEPWHATSVVLPFLCFVLLIWSISRGDTVCLPWAALTGSLVLQTSLSYVLLVPGLAAWGLLGLWLHLRRHGDDSDDRARLRGETRRRGLVALAVLAVCWAQPIWEQFTGAGVGNLSLLVRTSDQSLTRLSPMGTVLRVVEAAAAPPRVATSTLLQLYRNVTEDTLPSFVPLALMVVATAAAVAWCVRSARRRHDEESTSLLVTAAVLVVIGLVTATRAPAPELSGYQVRWVWPAAAFVLFAALTVVARHVAHDDADDGADIDRRPTVGAPRLVGAFVVVTGLFSALNLQPSHQGTSAPVPTFFVAADVVGQMHDVELESPVRLRCAPPTAPYCQAVMTELDGRGIDFMVDDPGGLRSLGGFRSAAGRSSGDELVVVSGPLAELPAPGHRRIAFNAGLDEDERGELFFLTVGLAEHLAEPGDHLSPSGRLTLRQGGYTAVGDAVADGDLDGDVAFDFGATLPDQARKEVSAMIEQDLLQGDGPWQEKMDRYAELTARNEFETVAVFVRDR